TWYCCGVSFFFSSSAEGLVVAVTDDGFVVVSIFFSSCFCAPARLRKLWAPTSASKTITQMTSRRRERGSGRLGMLIIDERILDSSISWSVHVPPRARECKDAARLIRSAQLTRPGRKSATSFRNGADHVPDKR